MKKILIVDDEPNIVMSLNIHLRKIISSFLGTDKTLDILEKQFRHNHSRCNDAWLMVCHIRTNKKMNSCDIARSFSIIRRNKRTFVRANLYVTKPFSIKN
jgi:DNA-binding response OmpR family regulator